MLLLCSGPSLHLEAEFSVLSSGKGRRCTLPVKRRQIKPGPSQVLTPVKPRSQSCGPPGYKTHWERVAPGNKESWELGNKVEPTMNRQAFRQAEFTFARGKGEAGLNSPWRRQTFQVSNGARRRRPKVLGRTKAAVAVKVQQNKPSMGARKGLKVQILSL